MYKGNDFGKPFVYTAPQNRSKRRGFLDKRKEKGLLRALYLSTARAYTQAYITETGTRIAAGACSKKDNRSFLLLEYDYILERSEHKTVDVPVLVAGYCNRRILKVEGQSKAAGRNLQRLLVHKRAAGTAIPVYRTGHTGLTEGHDIDSKGIVKFLRHLDGLYYQSRMYIINN